MQVLLAVLCLRAAAQQAAAVQQLWVPGPIPPEKVSFDAKKLVEADRLHIDGIPTGNITANPKAGKILRKIKEHIVGGNIAFRGMIPWQVIVESKRPASPSGIGFCGGALIAENVVLTAAHCVKDVKINRVMFGVQRRSDTRDRRIVMKNVENVVVHKNYQSNKLNDDIAIIKLPRKVKIGQFINTVKLPSMANASQTHEGYLVMASGWGRLQKRGKVSDELRYLKNKAIISNKECDSYLGNIQPTQICIISGDKRPAISIGDSGGPLTTRGSDNTHILLGITSFVASSKRKGMPQVQVFTRVTSYLKWISENSDIKINP